MTARRTNVAELERRNTQRSPTYTFFFYTILLDADQSLRSDTRSYAAQKPSVSKLDYLFISNAFPGEVFSPPSSKPRRRQTSADSGMSSGSRPSFTHERFATISSENGGNKRTRGPREDNFTIKHGSRHHSYDSEKAPYPLSYDKEFIGL